MSRPLQVVIVAGSGRRPSRTLGLLNAIAAQLGQHVAIQTEVVALSDLSGQLLSATELAQLPDPVRQKIAAIESADLLLAGSPVYRGSYSGLFKHLFDLVPQESLFGKPVLLAATGGSDRHALAIDHQLRPLFAFFQALTLPLGVYANAQEFDNETIISAALQERIALTVQRALPVLQGLAASAAPSRAAR
ncbi:FMN reductase [Herbaspirillum sp.]|jgi:FMN reductase|uniref:FMN reductase n=1 Tax=Herbaspirillum TaxID=963 RepID=UPI00258E00FE|nr:FMN reductase [Herbaspirillum sp.]MCP3655841.1 FMN reductase [Herbaspirillum sp.]MCP3948028.1 FMN reductase [Herbaspirillum sp.]MCP4030669.1 FMN reductase [Herbaspirillum sp.]MCP4557506.1 FMN reductase [Herbaspirillum sp.]